MIFGTWEKLVFTETALTKTMLNQGFPDHKNSFNVNGIFGGLLLTIHVKRNCVNGTPVHRGP